MRLSILSLTVTAAVVLGGCSDSKGGDKDSDAGNRRDAARGSNFGNASGDGDDNFIDPSFVSEEHFFINDDPPPMCHADGGMTLGPEIEGPKECPGDKNRQGCPCETVADVQPCWPGLRANRDHGICKDGVATCYETVEFGNRWGPCDGYTLPQEGALRGPEACRCFSSGSWELSNLSPCQTNCTGANDCFLYSSRPDPVDGKVTCAGVSGLPPSVPDEIWGTSALTMDCGGLFELCFTIKAGFASEPQDDDCVITRQCVEVWYGSAGERMELPPMPGWASDQGACTQEFVSVSGYGEMSIQGVSKECDDVDDGNGDPLVFFRTKYCPASCQDTPDTPDCAKCSIGGSGDF